MRELNVEEAQGVSGGIIPVVVAIVAAAIVSGCATTPDKETRRTDN